MPIPRRSLTLMTLLAVSVAVPAWAQVVSVSGTNTGQESHAAPEAVVARLMSFDQNHDGRVTRAELPERMHGLFALLRVDAVTTEDALDAAAVRSLAERPAPEMALRGLQPGHYGFGEDSGFDTRLHIEGAIEDLRLASAKREKALVIGRAFAASVQNQAKAELLASAQAVLTPEQLIGFKAALEQEPTLNVGSDDPAKVEELRASLTRTVRLVSVTQLVVQYPLGENEKRSLQGALDRFARFNLHDPVREGQRAALLGELRGVLSDQERDDLRAALERRPIVKQGAVTAARMTISATIPPDGRAQRINAVVF